MSPTPPFNTPPPVNIPSHRFNFAEHLLALNEARGSKPAFVDDTESLSYAELSRRVQAVSAALRDLGIRREERVLLLMQDCTDWPVAFLGAMHAGVVPVAVNTLLTADDYAYMLEHSRAQAALVSGALLPTLQQAFIQATHHEVRHVAVSRPSAAQAQAASQGIARSEFTSWFAEATARAPAKAAPTHPDDPGFWLYSSGSTGRPKGTVHTHANPYFSSELYGRRLLQLTEHDVCFSAAKLFFAYGLGNGLTFPLTVGATTVLLADRPTPDAVFKRWVDGGAGAPGLKPTVFFGAPTGYAGMLAHPLLPERERTALRMASSAGEALPADIGERFKAHYGVDIVDGIGSTEMLHIFLSNRPGQVCYGTTGWPVPGYEIELRGEDGGPVPEGEPGDLYIKGPSAALMYWANRDKSRETFQGGWTKSGDKYVRNPDGTYTYSGRSDDMLKVSGIYVSPFEVEATLVQHPAVLEAAVIGKVDEEGLTKTKAFVVLKAGQLTDEAQLKAFVKERLAPYKYPRYIEFVTELPKTATGKIQRFRLREREQTKG